MQLTNKHKEYWNKTLTITAVLLFVWFVATFVVGYMARDLSFNFFAMHRSSFYSFCKQPFLIRFSFRFFSSPISFSLNNMQSFSLSFSLSLLK